MTTYMTAGELYEEGGESSSATSSDYGGDDIDPTEATTEAERVYFQYRRAKRAWRRHTGRPTRRFRRAFRLHKFRSNHDSHFRKRRFPQFKRFDSSYRRYLADTSDPRSVKLS